jgi:hypothetical protein
MSCNQSAQPHLVPGGVLRVMHEADMIDDFVDLRRGHAGRQERLLYAWSEQTLSMNERHALFSWLLARLEERMAHTLSAVQSLRVPAAAEQKVRDSR